MIPQTILLQETNFNVAWSKLVSAIIKSGESSIIGDANDRHPIIGLSGAITLKHNAIRQIELGEIHSDYPFKAIEQYTDQFTYTWLEQNGTGGFDYTYFQRLVDYGGIDQLLNMCGGLQDQIDNQMSSNRNHSITYQPIIDNDAESPPCLQSINIRYVGNNQVDVFTYWRSRDAFTAWQSNIIAIIQMLNEYIIKINNCTIRSYTEFCNSYHIYKSDIHMAKNISPNNPQEQ